MKVDKHRTIDRCAAAILALLDGAVGRRKLPPRRESSREQVNALPTQLGEDVVAEALHQLYRKAEADARRRAILLAAALRDTTSSRRTGLPDMGPRRKWFR